MVGLNQARTRTVGEFSKGMQRRMGLAQALINDPDLIILDEPTAGLDPLGCREVKDLILALARRGKTIILSSHLLSDVEDVCDRAVIYYGGRIQAQGPLQELLARPDSVRFTSPVLSRELTEKVIALIRSEAGDKVRIENPTQNLESYFLGVVEAARKQAETSGATSGNRVAEYLRGDSESAGVQTDAVLNRLTRGSETLAPKVIESSLPPESTAESRLASLTRPEAAAVDLPINTAPAPTHGPTAAPVDLSKANERLSGLINGKK